MPNGMHAQLVTLNADGPGNTYELINSALAPGYNAVEHPECVHPAFGRHVAEVFDADINTNVFEFYMHVAEDNDRCINFDRQRMEIKTYESSPNHLKGTVGETITYKWRFRLAPGFQPSTSFTHIHQVKAVGGDDGDPIFTLTARKAAVNKLELIHDNTSKVAIVDLSLFVGVWVEATEVVNVGANGTYSLIIKRVSNNATLLSYSSNNIMTIRADNDFIRPKWGIYRSLNNPGDLRNESIRFNAFSIEENAVIVPIKLLSFNAALYGSGVKLNWKTASEINSKMFSVERSSNGSDYTLIAMINAAGNSNFEKAYQVDDAQPLGGKNFYRLKQSDINGQFTYSPVAYVFYNPQNAGLQIYPNPVHHKIQLNVPGLPRMYEAVITNTTGQNIYSVSGNVVNINDEINRKIGGVKPGVYFINLVNTETSYRGRFVKN